MIGDIGESVAISNFLMHELKVLLPFDDNSPYDLVINDNENFFKIQVKTCEKVLFGEYMKFEIIKTNPFTKINTKYTKSEVDYFVLYCIENNWCGLIDYETHKPCIRFRITDTLNNQSKNVKFAKDFEIHKQIALYFNKEELKKKIVHNEKKKKPIKKLNYAQYVEICKSKLQVICVKIVI